MRAQIFLSTGDPQMVGTDKIIIIILRNTRFPIFLEIFQTDLLWLGQVLIYIPQERGFGGKESMNLRGSWLYGKHLRHSVSGYNRVS